MKVLVTGCAGFIGSHVVEALLARGDSVVGIDNFDPYYDVSVKKRNLALFLANDKFVFHEDDAGTTDVVDKVKPDAIIHLAAKVGVLPSLSEPLECERVNVLGFLHLLEEARKNGVTRVIYASSSSVYGTNAKVPFAEDDPIELGNSPYACSKRNMEIYAGMYSRLYGIGLVGLRFFTVYGPRGRPDMAPHKFLSAILSEKTLTKYGDGSSSRDYTYVDDIVRGVLSATDRCAQGQHVVYNLGNSSPVTLNEFIACCERATDKTAECINVGEKLGDVPQTYADISKATHDLGYLPQISLDDGLSRMTAWMLCERSVEVAAPNVITKE
jgi:UDP-glucuronate 4-epimerase